MNYRETLLQPLSLRYADRVAELVFENPDDFNILFQLMFDSQAKVAWRAAWVCQKISQKFPDWFTEIHFAELSKLSLTTQHAGVLRGCLSILNNITFPTSISVDLINACFDWMISPKSPIAVQAYSMKILFKICLIEPDLVSEFKTYLENVNTEYYSAGFNSCRNNILKRLNNN